MSRDEQLKQRWESVVHILSEKFSGGEDLDLEGIIYLIGVQELGKIHATFKKDEKVNLMHIAICRLLEPYGYYEFEYYFFTSLIASLSIHALVLSVNSTCDQFPKVSKTKTFVPS